MPDPTHLFLVYSDKDRSLLLELISHTSALERGGSIKTWHADLISPGVNRAAEFERAFAEARIVLILVSPDLFTSEAAHALVQRTMLRAKAGEVVAIPILLRPTAWEGTTLGSLEPLPSDRTAITEWRNRDQAWLEIVFGIGKVIEGAVDKQAPLEELLRQAQSRYEQIVVSGGSTVERETAMDRILELKRQIRDGRPFCQEDVVANRYRLIRELGRGGFASVWRAFDRELEIEVALKILHTQHAGEPARRERFFQGARAMRRLHHPNIVRVLEARPGSAHPYCFCMEFIGGGNLRDHVLEEKRAPTDVLRQILEVGEALQYAHEAGVIHRDVKPTNILLRGEGTVCLTDFDLVQVSGWTGGTRSEGMGTFIYAAPEQMKSARDVDARCDVFSLAMTAVFGLHGKDLPIEAFRDTELFINALEASEPVRTVLRKATQWERERRFPTIAAFCTALELALTQEDSVAQLKMALREGGIRLAFHPRFHLKHGGIIGVEAVIEWQHPTRGLISSEDLMPLVDGSSLTAAVFEWTVGEALRLCKVWRTGLVGAVPVSVVLPRALLNINDLHDRIGRLLAENDAMPESLELAVSEGSLLEGAILPGLHELRRLGVKLSLDAFGSGSSSLSYLQLLQIDTLIIDRSFIMASIEEKGEAIKIIKAIVELARTLNIRPFARGVEDKTQLELMLSLGMEGVQGSLFCRACTAAEIDELSGGQEIKELLAHSAVDHEAANAASLKKDTTGAARMHGSPGKETGRSRTGPQPPSTQKPVSRAAGAKRTLTSGSTSPDPSTSPDGPWRILVPARATVGPDPQEILGALGPLAKHRRALEPLYYDPGTPANSDAVREWIERNAPLIRRTAYLLIAGDSADLPFELDYQLARTKLVGRLSFPAGDAYATYATKVISAEASASRLPVRPILVFAPDSDRATSFSRNRLAEPVLRVLPHEVNRVVISLVKKEATLENLVVQLSAQTLTTPSLLIAFTHGVEAADPESMEQGSLVDQNLKCMRVPELIESGTFLADGIAFLYGDCSGGTPKDRSMPKIFSQRPFNSPSSDRVSQMPAALLGLKRGPLGIVAHIDTLSNWSVRDYQGAIPDHDESPGILPLRDFILAVARSVPLGLAMRSLTRAAADHEHDYMRALSDLQDTETKTPEQNIRLGRRWLRWRHTKGWIALGDPRVCLEGVRGTMNVDEALR